MDSGKETASLWALSPLDGRYSRVCGPLRDLFSEGALIRERVVVEVRYWIRLLEFLGLELPNAADQASLLDWAAALGDVDLERVKQIEARLRHDVKAVEYLIREHARGTVWEQHSSWIHWGLTSEDTDSLAYGRLLARAASEVIVPSSLELVRILCGMIRRDARVVMLARTHGQVAVPTTMGKEWAVFLSRAAFWLGQLRQQRLSGKLSGAVGNYNAQTLLFPELDWQRFARSFIAEMGLEPSPITTQIDLSSYLVLFLDRVRQLNNVWLDLAQNVWLYAALGTLRLKAVPGEVGSSTMPHKVNPIHFEGAEGNLQMSSALLEALSDKLSLSRLQRDLSDKTAKRNIGVALGHSLVATEALAEGLARVEPDEEALLREVRAHPEVLSEALQLWRRSRGQPEAFAGVQSMVRGSASGWEELVAALGDEERGLVSGWKPETYSGLAEELALAEVERIEVELGLADNQDGSRAERGSDRGNRADD